MPTPTPAPKVLAFEAKDVESNKFIAALSYVGILFLIPLLAARQSPFAQEHARQGLVLFIATLIGSFIFWLPIFGWLLGLLFVVIHIVAIVKTLMGEFWEIPVLGPWREKIKV